MTNYTYLLGAIGSVLYLIVVFEMLRRRRLRERHVLWWSVGGFIALLVSLFPSSLDWLARTVGVVVPANLVFFIALFILFMVTMQQSAELTTLERRTQALADRTTLQDLRIAELERRQDPKTAERERRLSAGPDGSTGADGR